MRTSLVLSLFVFVATLGQVAPVLAASNAAAAAEVTARQLHDAQQTRFARLRSLAGIFHKIAVQKNWQGSHVVYRDQEVTAFLDITDPAHPHFDATRPDEDAGLAAIPVARRAHVLVVPNTPREHIAQSLDAQITKPDLETALAVIAAGHRIAQDLNLANPRVYINQTHQIGVGYLHVHVVGERTGAYPQVATPE